MCCCCSRGDETSLEVAVEFRRLFIILLAVVSLSPQTTQLAHTCPRLQHHGQMISHPLLRPLLALLLLGVIMNALRAQWSQRTSSRRVIPNDQVVLEDGSRMGEKLVVAHFMVGYRTASDVKRTLTWSSWAIPIHSPKMTGGRLSLSPETHCCRSMYHIKEGQTRVWNTLTGMQGRLCAQPRARGLATETSSLGIQSPLRIAVQSQAIPLTGHERTTLYVDARW